MQSPSQYRNLLPMPDTGISIAAQLDPEKNPRYIASVATDVQTGTIYSAYLLEDRYICRINDREVDPEAFPLIRDDEVKSSKINLPFYSHTGFDFMKDIIMEINKSVGTKRIYPGRCRASIVDMIRMLAGDCDAMIDMRALQPDKCATLKPYDVYGMIPFFEGLGWHVCDENGNPIA